MFYTSFNSNATSPGNLYEDHVLQLYKSFLKSKNIDVSISLLLSESHSYFGSIT